VYSEIENCQIEMKVDENSPNFNISAQQKYRDNYFTASLFHAN